jgi:hypothetical protein
VSSIPDAILQDTGDFKRLSKELGKTAEGKQLRKELTKSLRTILKPFVADVKASYSGGRHLRPLLKKATHSIVRTSGREVGARVLVDGRRMPSNMKRLPQYYEGQARRPWRHPVFANRNEPRPSWTWVDQGPRPRGRFKQITARFEAEAGREIRLAGERSLEHLK